MNWIRTCQECGHQQICPRPNSPKIGDNISDAYRERKCKRCKSSGLDYGTEGATDAPVGDWDE